MDQSVVPGARFVDPTVLARIGNLELVARAVVDGFINGIHRSPYFGASIDFAEHRGYVPGDDIRRVDWRLYARTDRYYIKEYEADTNSNFSVLLDVSKSMGFGSGGVTEAGVREDACRLPHLPGAQAAGPCRLRGVRQRHRRARSGVGEAHGHVSCTCSIVSRPTGPGSLRTPLHKMAEHFGRRGLLVLISDLYEEPDAVLEAIGPLRFRGNDIAVFHLLDKAELDFTFRDPSAFEDLESGDQIPIVPDALADQYKELVQAHVNALRERFSANRIDYTMLNTSSPLDHALFSYLTMRERLSRVR